MAACSTYDFIISFREQGTLRRGEGQISLHRGQEVDRLAEDAQVYHVFFDAVHISDPLELAFLHQEAGRLSFAVSQLESAYLAQLIFTLLHHIGPEENPVNTLLVHNVIEQIVLTLMVRTDKPQGITVGRPLQSAHETAHRYLSFIKNHVREHKNVSYYCLKLEIPAKALAQATKITYGCTPKELIHRELMRIATEYLVLTTMSVKQIAYTLGFEENNNFSALFKRHTGITPRAFRERATASAVPALEEHVAS